MQRAGVLVRFFAVFLDGIIMAAVTFAVVFGWALFAGGASQTESGAAQALAGVLGVLVYVFIILLQFLYYGYFWSRNGESPGKRVLGIRVVSTAGGPISFIRAGLRGTVGYWLSGLLFGLGFIWAIFDANSETWHDKIFATRVVRS